jgi:hypothetical protein
VYWPQTEAGRNRLDQIDNIPSNAYRPFFNASNLNQTGGTSISPDFSAGVQLDAQLDFIVTPEA